MNMKRMGGGCGACVIVMALGMVGCSQIDGAADGRGTPRRYLCPRVMEAPRIDGRLDDAVWARAEWSVDFVDIEGEKRPAPRHRTRMKMLWDDRHLYIGASLTEPHVWATLTQRDAIVFNDNDFEVFIDPDGDERGYYELEFNAYNTVFDLFLVRTYLKGGPALHDWDMRGLRSAIHVDGTLNDPRDTDAGWSVEMALPWRSLAEAAGTDAPPKPGDTWRMNFSRVQWQHEIVNGRYRRVANTKEDNWVWSPQGVIDMHRPRHWGYVTFGG